VERWLGVIVLVGAVVGVTVSLSREQYTVAAAIGIAVVVLGLLRLNWQEIQRRDDEVRHWRNEAINEVKKSIDRMGAEINRVTEQHAWNTLIRQMTTGTEHLKSLRVDEGSELEWRATIDQWARANTTLFSDGPYVRYAPTYSRDSGLPSVAGDWRDRLVEYVYIRLQRMREIMEAEHQRAREAAGMTHDK